MGMKSTLADAPRPAGFPFQRLRRAKYQQRTTFDSRELSILRPRFVYSEPNGDCPDRFHGNLNGCPFGRQRQCHSLHRLDLSHCYCKTSAEKMAEEGSAATIIF
jgi:hypothetical protein